MRDPESKNKLGMGGRIVAECPPRKLWVQTPTPSKHTYIYIVWGQVWSYMALISALSRLCKFEASSLVYIVSSSPV